MKVSKRNKKIIFYSIAAIILIGLLLSRFLFLKLRPVHHDEGMLAYFAYKLFKDGEYVYTPQIHGPILFYVQALIFKLFSDNDATLRYGPAIFGVLLGLIPIFFSKILGKKRAIAISILILFSPILMYYGRFLVHTALYVVFISLFILFAYLFFKSFKTIYLFLTSAMLSLAFGTSETTYIFCAILFGFIPVYYLVQREHFKEKFKLFKKYFFENYYDFISAALIFILVWIAIYSVGFTRADSLTYSLPIPNDQNTGLGFWLAQHPKKLGGQPWNYYLMLGFLYETVTMVAASLAVIFYKKKYGVFYLFLIWWSFASIFAFSWAGEKFPWLFLPSLIALIYLAGYFLGSVFLKFKIYWKVLLLFILLFAGFSAVRLNFYSPADTNELAVYVQTPASFQKYFDEINSECKDELDYECVVIDQKITWPLSWEFRVSSRLESAESNITLSEKTKYLLLSYENQTKEINREYERKEQVNIRDWWVPDLCRSSDCIGKFIRYYFIRETWNEKGGYDLILYKLK